MAPRADFVITKGDTRQLWRWTVTEQDSAGADVLAPLTAASILMINAATDAVKINYAAATVVSPGVATYQPVAADVDTAGLYWIWLRDITGGKAQHWPDGGRVRLIRIVDPAQA